MLGWSPDSRWLVFLAASESGASYGFYRVAAEGGQLTLLDAGVPYGWAWSPKSQEVAIHAGSVFGGLAANRLAFLDVEEVLEEGLGLPSGVFGAPSWSSDGRKIVVATLAQDHNRIYVTNRALTEGTALADLDGQVELMLSPRDDKLAYVLQDEEGARLYVLDVPARLTSRANEAVAAEASAQVGKLLSGDDAVAAFFWSPDGKRIAFFVPQLVSLGEGEEAQQALVLTLKFSEVARATVREAVTFFPTSAFLSMIQGFGQYAQALRIWSPDSRNVVYAGLDEEGPAVMVARAAENIQPRKLAGGHAASWSRR
jgi:Tol biopolymer transport system component